MKKISLLTLLLIALSITITAQPAEKMKRMQNPGMKSVPERLNLTEDQEKQFRDITFEHQKKVIDLKSAIEKNRLELKKMAAENKVDEKKLIDLTDANSKLQAEMKSLAVKKWIAINKILNDEQKAIWSKHLGMDRKKGMMKGAARGIIQQRVKERMMGRMK